MTRKQTKKPVNWNAPQTKKEKKSRARLLAQGDGAATTAKVRRRRDRQPSYKNPIVAGAYQQANNDVRSSILPAMRNLQVRDRPGSNVNRGERLGPEMLLRPRYLDYLKSISDPFGIQGVRSVVNYNPVPSLVTSTARLIATEQLTIAAGTGGGFVLGPGHGGVTGGTANAPNMDGPSYHAQCQNIGTAPQVCTVGPMPVGATVNIMGFKYTGTGLFVMPAGTNVASVTGIVPQIALPYVSQVSSGAHSRWKCVSMGIRITCTTIEASRSSTIISIQPNQRGYALGGLDVRALALNPSYHLGSEAFENTLELPWLPRLEDCAYWHTSTLTAQNTFEWAGMIVHIPNDTAISQTYMVELVQNYELAGEYLLAVGDESIHQPLDKGNFEPALNVLRLGATSAKGLPEVAATVAANAVGHPRVKSFLSKAAGHIGAAALAGLTNMIGN